MTSRTKIDSAPFGDALLFTVTTPNLRVQLTNYGAIVVSVQFRAHDDDAWKELTLGYNNLDEWKSDDAYLGATCGRFTGRIAKGQFTLDGCQYQLTTNNNGNTLHGGTEGFNKRMWHVEEVFNSTERVGVTFSLLSPHGDQGFPAALLTKASYFVVVPPSGGSLPASGLHMKFEASVDTSQGPPGLSTVVNIVNHNYWNLNGCVRGADEAEWPQPESCVNHVLQIDAGAVTVPDLQSVPTGEVQRVEGTPLDFRVPCALRDRVDVGFLGQRSVPGIDDNFILDRPAGVDVTSLRPVAEIFSPITGIKMRIATTLPGLQVYTTNYKPRTATGARGDRFAFRSAVCLETQFFPNAPNCPGFPSTTVAPNENWCHETVYSFSALESSKC